MALYTAQEATLGDLEGSGYAFAKGSTVGNEYNGVFFIDADRRDELESLVAEETVVFTGTVYTKNRSGGVRENQETFEVDVYNLISVGVGARADFRVVEQ